LAVYQKPPLAKTGRLLESIGEQHALDSSRHRQKTLLIDKAFTRNAWDHLTDSHKIPQSRGDREQLVAFLHVDTFGVANTRHRGRPPLTS
jgi:hypothetical protein